MTGWPRILPVGDQALAVEFGNAISPEINDRVYELLRLVEAEGDPHVTELVPTYRSLLVQYDAESVSFEEMREALAPMLESDVETGLATGMRTVFELPAAYGGEHGPDLEAVATHTGLSPETVIKIHSGAAYRVFMLGFAPGFPYLGGMDPSIACPRLKTPRTRVPAGSVGIAESQTGVYPNESPGGWQLIGRTPVRLFDPALDPPAVIQPGSFVRFTPVGEDEFAAIQRRAEVGEYVVARSERPA